MVRSDFQNTGLNLLWMFWINRKQKGMMQLVGDQKNTIQRINNPLVVPKLQIRKILLLHNQVVWDEASGYYYDASSGFYYEGNTGLYYDGNNGLWYSFDQQTQQYIPCSDQNNTSAKQSETSKPSDGPNTRKIVISAPAATIASLPDAVQAAAAAAIAAEKKEKEKLKEIKLASKSSILANKKKMNNVLSMWKQRIHERGQAPRVALNDHQEESSNSASSAKSKLKNEVPIFKENIMATSGFTSIPIQLTGLESQDGPRLAVSGTGGTFKGVIRSSGVYTEAPVPSATASSFSTFSEPSSPTIDASTTLTSFKKGASALGPYVPSSCRRRFSETASLPVPNKEEAQTIYRYCAAERRSLYGSSADLGDELSNAGIGDPNRESSFRRGVVDSMPFPPGVGGG